MILDLFDKPDTCRKVWDRLLSGHAFDALTVREPGGEMPSAADVIQLLQNLREVTWQRSEPLAEGEDYRAQSGAGDHASALLLHGALVHCNLMTAVSHSCRVSSSDVFLVLDATTKAIKGLGECDGSLNATPVAAVPKDRVRKLFSVRCEERIPWNSRLVSPA